MNQLVHTTTLGLLNEVFKVMVDMSRKSGPGRTMEIRLFAIGGRRYEPNVVQEILNNHMRPVELTSPCGLKFLELIDPAYSLNISTIEEIQDNQTKIFSKTSLNDIFAGHCFDEEAIKILSKETSQIVLALLKVFNHFMPIPVENICCHPRWKESVFFQNAGPNTLYFEEAADRFQNQFAFMSPVEYLELLSAIEEPEDLLFRSNVHTIKFLSIQESSDKLLEYLKFQFGNEWEDFFTAFSKIIISNMIISLKSSILPAYKSSKDHVRA